MTDTPRQCQHCEMSVYSGDELLCALNSKNKMLPYVERDHVCEYFMRYIGSFNGDNAEVKS